jgi:cytochrome c-type biogenesis protein
MIADLSIVALATSFVAGIVSFLSPCVLPLVPGYISYVAGQSLNDAAAAGRSRFAALGFSLLFVLGFSTVFVILGASATSLGRLLLSYRYEANLAGGVIVMLFGLLMIGLVRASWLQREFRIHLTMPGGEPVAAYASGRCWGAFSPRAPFRRRYHRACCCSRSTRSGSVFRSWPRLCSPIGCSQR